ncbi:hypothetical protein ACJMK2_040823 [Sinanodonta woodiana]|uniref:protein-tyrosine-phosphatase n=1 Tax=Sinanodonta woodiana TaxID=1069815 RepID=A0ABD3W5E7_SINWO
MSKVIDCGPPLDIPGNSTIKFLTGLAGNTSYNATFTIHCNNGFNYTHPGNETIRCDSNGHWTSNIGLCEVIDCGQPLDIPGNSTIVFAPGLEGNTSYNATFTIHCNNGFTYTDPGNETIRCENEGQWEGYKGLCEVIDCGQPLDIPGNSTIVFTTGLDGNTSYNATFTIHCNNGFNYTLPGNETIHCGNEGHWMGNFGLCEVIDCGPLNIPSNSNISYSTGLAGNTSYNATFTINCNKGFNYTLPGYETILCGKEGRWTGSPGLCKDHTDLTAAIIGSVVTLVILVALGVCIVIFMSSINYQNGHFANITSDEGVNVIETDADNGCYENIQNIRRNDIKIEDLFEFVLQRRSKSNLYEEEYRQATRSITKSKDVAMQVENKAKNRYKGMVPYDDNRVKLHVWDADIETDYINASFIDGFNRSQSYVAAQGPMENTLSDFWRMIWQLNTSKIVMLTNLTEGSGRKCVQYWPDEGSVAVDFGKISVQLIQTDQFSDFSIRTMKIKMNDCREDGNSRMIKQFHFTAWPDKSVPRYSSSMVHFRHKIYSTEDDGHLNGPLVVHCSAGVGRTGTFIAIDFLVNQAEAQGAVNVISCLESLRNQRVLMIQTLDQFIFVHEVLVEALTCTTSAVSAQEFQEEYRKLLTRDPKHKKTLLQLVFEKLQLLNLNSDENTYAIAKETGNRDKNRYCNILPDENYRPYLSTNVAGRNSYINAVFLPAYKENDAFLITQTPLENTIVDFWRMVYQYDVSSIVMLNTMSQMKDNERYWPHKGNVFNCPPFEIHLESEESFGCCDISKLILIYKEEHRNVRLSRARYWTENERVPKSPLHILGHVELVQGWQTESAGRNPVVVHCMNGADRSGLFCVIAAVLERTKIEQDVAIEQIVRQLRHRRSQIIPDLEQFKFCHEAVLAYLNQNDTYANF